MESGACTEELYPGSPWHGGQPPTKGVFPKLKGTRNISVIWHSRPRKVTRPQSPKKGNPPVF